MQLLRQTVPGSLPCQSSESTGTGFLPFNTFLGFAKQGANSKNKL
jgi:hypothetical protein